MYSELHLLMFPSSEIKASTFAIIGATAVLAGSTRMTFSLAVIMLETTSSVELFLPIVFTLFISYGTGSLLINKSIYLSTLRSKNIPLLVKDIPRENRQLTADALMSKNVRFFNFIVNVNDVYEQLSGTTLNGFIVVNNSMRVIGIIDRDSLVTLIQREAWYRPDVYREKQR